MMGHELLYLGVSQMEVLSQDWRVEPLNLVGLWEGVGIPKNLHC